MKPQNNYVLCRRLQNHFKDRTKGGIQVATEAWNRDQYLTQNAERIYEVVALPEKLNEQSGFWKTTMDLRIGDRIIAQYHQTLNAKTIHDDDGNEYRLLLYYGIIAAIRGTDIIPVNGYFLFTPVYKEYKTMLILPNLPKEIEYFSGKVEYVSEGNERYVKNDRGRLSVDKSRNDTGIIISKGDTVKFMLPWPMFAPPLEEEPFVTLDKKYFYTQRHKIGAKII
jgi:hypothetical protein